MASQRELNREITEKIKNLLTDIMPRAAKINHKEICDKASKCMALLDDLSFGVPSDDSLNHTQA